MLQGKTFSSHSASHQPGVKKQVLANCQGKLIKCWGNLGWTSIPSRGGVGGNTHSCLMLQKVG